MKDGVFYLIFLIHSFNTWQDGNGISIKLARAIKKLKAVEIYNPNLSFATQQLKFLFVISEENAIKRIKIIKELPGLHEMLQRKNRRSYKNPNTDETNNACHKIAVNWLKNISL